jgi:hypothetical protein
MPPRLRAWLLDAFSADLRVLAAFRIGLALIILWDLGERLPDLTAHYTDAGVFPRALISLHFGEVGPVALHALSGSAAWQAALFAAAILCALALLVGWKTRWAALASWLLMLSLHHRNPAVL